MTARTLADGRFRVERTLGEGGMATVHLAHDETLDRPVAVKVLSDRLAHDAEVRERFVREARHAAGLAHPNVVAVFDVGEEDGRPFIVMEYVEGETVAELLARRGPLPPAEAVALAAQACAALEHAHASGVVHRDVKPGNLLRREDGHVKIADFGIARAAAAAPLTEAGTILGTAAYLAPEQARGEEVTAAADVYALGAVLYELLTGRPPHTHDSLARLAHGEEREPPTPVRELAPEVPPALEDAAMRALARRPEHRQDSARALRHELEAALADEDARTTRRLAAPATTPHVARSRRRIVLAALAALVLLALVAAAVAGSGDDETPPPARVEPVSPAGDPAERARNLADWLRERAADSP